MGFLLHEKALLDEQTPAVNQPLLQQRTNTSLSAVAFGGVKREPLWTESLDPVFINRLFGLTDWEQTPHVCIKLLDLERDGGKIGLLPQERQHFADLALEKTAFV